MMDAILSLAAVSSLLLSAQLSPGPDVFVVFRTALAGGFRSGSAVAAGISAGSCIQAAVACTLGAWVMQQDWATWVLYAAAAWLLYLAWKIFPRRGGVGDDSVLDAPTTIDGPWALFRQGFICNILNPKCMLFFCMLSAGALEAHAGRFPWFTAALVLSITLTGQLGWMLWSALLQWRPIKGVYLRHMRNFDALFSVLLAIFALLLITES